MIRESYEASKRIEAERRANEKTTRDNATFEKDGTTSKSFDFKRHPSPGRTSTDAGVRQTSTNPVPTAGKALRRSVSARATVSGYPRHVSADKAARKAEAQRIDAEEAVRQAEAQRKLEEGERQRKAIEERQSKAQASRARIENASFEWYAVLGISPNAPVDEIKKTFRDLALLHHPDKSLDDDENAVTFKHVLDAFRKGLRVAGDPNRVRVPEPAPATAPSPATATAPASAPAAQQFKPPDKSPPAADEDLPGAARRNPEARGSTGTPPTSSRANSTPRSRCSTDSPKFTHGPPPQMSEGVFLVSVSADRSARLWNWHTGKCDCVVRGHTRDICSGSCTSDGKFFVTASFDRTMKIWDVETGMCSKTIQDPAGQKASGMMLKAEFSPEGNRIVTVGHGSNLKVWNARAGTCEQVLRGHSCDVLCASFSPDGKSIISGSSDRTVRTWIVATGKCHKVLRGHEAPVTAVSLSPVGNAAASASEDALAIIWNVDAGHCVLKLEGHTTALNEVCFSRNGDLIATCSEDGRARVWNASSGECMQVIPVCPGSVKCVAFSPDGHYLATGSSDYRVSIWNRTTGKRVLQMSGHEDVVRSIFFV